jgi:hypothetical protein
MTCRIGVSLVKLPDLDPAPLPFVHTIVQLTLTLCRGFP